MNVLSSPRNARIDDADTPPARQSLAENLAMAFGVGVPFLGLLAGIILLWGNGVTATDLWLLLAMYIFTTFGVTIGFHRLFTHRAFETGRVMRFILGVAGSMSAQGPVIEWCAMHRRHHQHSDRDGDPHSPHAYGRGMLPMLQGMWHAHLGWLFKPEPPGLAKSVADLLADPVLRLVDRLFWLWLFLGWLIPGLIGGLISGTWLGALSGFIWGGLIRTFLLHHTTWCVNSVCHVWGTRPFATHDESRNNPVMGILVFGEGWHNNHHAFPTSARHGLTWWQLDKSYLVIRLLCALRLAWNLRLPPEAAIRAKLRPTSDLTDRNPCSSPSETSAASARCASLSAQTGSASAG